MQSVSRTKRFHSVGASLAALVVGLALAPAAQAQTDNVQSLTARDEPSSTEERGGSEIIVTGSRIERSGFDRPTPTMIIGDTELRQGQRPNLQQVLNDSTQFRPTTTPQVSPGNTSSGSAPVDLRGLGANRTLTLVNGRRFVGQNNLNYLPIGMVQRVEVVTGGASAAYGSDAVAGVVNLILKDSIEGITVGGQSGISSRGDGRRYGADLTAGTSFADGRGQILFSAEYVKDEAIADRNSRRNLGSAAIVRLNPTIATDTRQVLLRDVNYGDRTSGGLITSGIFAGQMFNTDGTLSAYRGGTSLAANPAATPFPAQVVGGADAVGLYDAVAVTTPLERISTFARASYDMGSVRFWADATYGRSKAEYGFLPDIGAPASLTIQANNPFLSQSIRTALAAAGETSFRLGRFFDGPFMLRYAGTREQIEGAIGFDADLGAGWKARAHYSHGEIDFKQRVLNTRIASRFNNAINAVSSNGQIVCAINADATTANDDPACRAMNLFGLNGPSAESLAYTQGTQQNDTKNKLDAAAVEVQGDLLNLWAGPLTVVVGAEARWEKQVSRSGALDLAGAFGALNLYGAPVSGGFNVKEGFGEVALPLLNIEGTAKIDLNGAARYSDYSRSGGIWSWKGGATVGLFDALMLRATRSRDIRAPTIGELFSVRSLNIQPVVDQDGVGRNTPGYNPTPQQVTVYNGGNPDLLPEISYTTTIGGSFSPKFLPGFNLSVDYYDIEIRGAITTLSATNLTLACRNGNAAACDRVTRDGSGTITEVRSNSQNIARFETSGFDIEASYLLRMSDLSSSMPGTLRLRAVATHVRKFVFDTGISRIDTAGDLGSSTSNAIPKWRGVLSLAYETDKLGLDARLRYVGSGKFNHLLDGTNGQPLLVNNEIGAATYLDLGAQFKVAERFTLSASVNNVFDRKPPISPTGPAFHDAIGTYFTMSARVSF